MPGSSEAYKRSTREVVERRAEVGGGIVAVIGVDNTTRRSEGPPAGCVIATAKTLWVEEPCESLGSVVNLCGVRECGRSTARGKAG